MCIPTSIHEYSPKWRDEQTSVLNNAYYPEKWKLPLHSAQTPTIPRPVAPSTNPIASSTYPPQSLLRLERANISERRDGNVGCRIAVASNFLKCENQC